MPEKNVVSGRILNGRGPRFLLKEKCLKWLGPLPGTLICPKYIENMWLVKNENELTIKPSPKYKIYTESISKDEKKRNNL